MSNVKIFLPAGHLGLCPSNTLEFCPPPQLPCEDPQHALYEPFLHTTHSTLHVVDQAGPAQSPPASILVTVFDGSNGTRIPFSVKSIDTIGKLQLKYEKMRPELVGKLNLAYNGKPAPKLKTMQDLGVKPGAMFITYQKVTGG